MTYEEQMVIKSVSNVLGIGEEKVMKTPFVKLIRMLVSECVEKNYEIANIKKEKAKSDITIKAIEDFIEVYKK